MTRPTTTTLLICMLVAMQLGYAAYATGTGTSTATWIKMGDDWSPVKPPGELRETENKVTVTLPNGHTYTTKAMSDSTLVLFPNGQKFSSESAKFDRSPVFVNEDETIVARVAYPATKTADLHVYVRGNTGQYRELANENNQSVIKLLKRRFAEFGDDYVMLDVRRITGRTLTLWAISRRDDEYYRCEFDLQVGEDGSLSLSPQKPSNSKSGGDARGDKTVSPHKQNLQEETPDVTTGLKLSTSLPDGPSPDVLEQGLRNFVARNPSLNRYSSTSGMADMYRMGAIANKVTAATISNEYTRSVEGEKIFVYDFDIEATNPYGPVKTTVSIAFVKRGKKWYLVSVPN